MENILKRNVYNELKIKKIVQKNSPFSQTANTDSYLYPLGSSFNRTHIVIEIGFASIPDADKDWELLIYSGYEDVEGSAHRVSLNVNDFERGYLNTRIRYVGYFPTEFIGIRLFNNSPEDLNMDYMLVGGY